MSRDFLLVIPAYEEHRRLPPFLRELVNELAHASFTTEIRIVDDGSSAPSRRELEQALAEITASASVALLPILSLPARRGKGGAIRTGWNAGPPARWLAFVDADGAIPAREVRRIFEQIAPEPAAGLCVGLRAPAAGRRVQRVWYRRWISAGFVRIIQVLFRSRFRDPQCGFKIISSSAWESVKAQSREDGFCFDLELLLLLRAQRTSIRELPIDWTEKPGSHISPLRDGCRTLSALASLWMRTATRPHPL